MRSFKPHNSYKFKLYPFMNFNCTVYLVFLVYFLVLRSRFSFWSFQRSVWSLEEFLKMNWRRLFARQVTQIPNNSLSMLNPFKANVLFQLMHYFRMSSGGEPFPVIMAEVDFIFLWVIIWLAWTLYIGLVQLNAICKFA